MTLHLFWCFDSVKVSTVLPLRVWLRTHNPHICAYKLDVQMDYRRRISYGVYFFWTWWLYFVINFVPLQRNAWSTWNQRHQSPWRPTCCPTSSSCISVRCAFALVDRLSNFFQRWRARCRASWWHCPRPRRRRACIIERRVGVTTLSRYCRVTKFGPCRMSRLSWVWWVDLPAVLPAIFCSVVLTFSPLPCSMGPVWVSGPMCYHCRRSPPRFLAECRKRRLNQGSFVCCFFRLFTLSDLCLVFACLFSCTVFVFSYCMFIFLYCFVCQYQSSHWL